ncbi:hypothetical protein LCGC14_1241790 [marine sediment metagenome]|uniref:Thymidylate kinase-like domain-containing protein n=1 Tax=marine sediment metagenome TaxID=412755 RepID=A0A0F9L5L3_9ZZZZ
MLHIAIEGVDGVGKTTVSEIVAERLNFKFIEKPLHYLFDSENEFENYFRIRDYVNSQGHNKVFTSWFYGLGNIFLYHKFKNENIVSDRHLVSNFYWSGDESSKKVFDCMIELIGKPDFTFLLYAKEESIRKRIINRDTDDPDVNKTQLSQSAYIKMENFLKDYKMIYKLIDTSELNANEVAEVILRYLSEGGIVNDIC